MSASEASPPTRPRPLSPHLQVYRPQIGSVLSILHRITGVALTFGTLLFAWWIIAAAAGPGPFAAAQGFIGSWIGLMLLVGWSWALFYHLANGVRHLFWDAGYGFEIDTFERSGWAVVIVSAALTVLVWIVALIVW